MLTKKEASDAFISIISNDAFDVAHVIIKELQEQQLYPSLENEVCRNVFSAEWFTARLIRLQLKAHGIRDAELKGVFVHAIEAAMAEILRNIPDLGQVRADYYLMAMMFEKGERTPDLGITYGPGGHLAMRYQKHVRAISDEFDLNDLHVLDEEMAAIMLLGDSICWSLNGDFDDALNSMLT